MELSDSAAQAVLFFMSEICFTSDIMHKMTHICRFIQKLIILLIIYIKYPLYIFK